MALTENNTADRRRFLKMMAGTAMLAGLPLGCRTVTKGRYMKISNLAMPPFNTTLMGVVKGALDYYGAKHSGPTVFGTTGHAFVINIHKELCPSGPYVWRIDRAEKLLRNLGLVMVDLGFFSAKSSRKDRAAVEETLRDHLDRGVPCSMCNLDNQLITGYDDDGLFAAQPWATTVDATPDRLSFKSWKEFGRTFHVNFYTLRPSEPAPKKKAILESLDYAVDLHRNHDKHSREGYGIGPAAYSNWIKAAEKYGASHGNWWNGTVWSECRSMASGYFKEIGELYGSLSVQTTALEKAYTEIANNISIVSDKKMPAEKKIALLEQTQADEAVAIEKIITLTSSLRSSTRA